MKKLCFVLSALLLSGCALNPPPSHWPTYTVVVDIAGPTTPGDLRVNWAIDDQRASNCVVSPALHVLCSATGPAPFGSSLQITAPKGYRSPPDTRVLLDPKAPQTKLGTIGLAKSFEQRTGVVHLDGKAWADDQGRFDPFGATYFYALDVLKLDEARFRKTLDWFSLHHVQFVRILGQVAWPVAPGSPLENAHDIYIRPSDGEYGALLAKAIDIAYDEYGIRTELSIYGEWPTLTDPDGWSPVDTVRVVRGVVATRMQKMHSIELTNEGHIPDEVTLFAMGDVLKDLGLLMSPTTPEDQAQASRWIGQHGFTHVTPRFERGNGDFDWRFVRQPSEWQTVFDHNEPQGPASSLAQTSDPLRLAMARALSISRGGGSYVLHNAAGINGFKDDTRGRTAEVWDMPGIDAIMEAAGRVHEIIPDVEGWSRTSQSGHSPYPGQVLTSDAIWSDGDDHGVNRNYGNTSPDGRFVQFPSGIKNYANFIANVACHVKAYNPVTREVVSEVDLAVGQSWRLEGDPDTNTAYILVGQTH